MYFDFPCLLPFTSHLRIVISEGAFKPVTIVPMSFYCGFGVISNMAFTVQVIRLKKKEKRPGGRKDVSMQFTYYQRGPAPTEHCNSDERECERISFYTYF